VANHTMIRPSRDKLGLIGFVWVCFA
jgi:hypothetical protein